ncbi:MAG: hypothetical protein QOH74_1266, partial [Gaiellales bacterium]|nr:hypothetical protein [Gaiellales bacterium]
MATQAIESPVKVSVALPGPVVKLVDLPNRALPVWVDQTPEFTIDGVPSCTAETVNDGPAVNVPTLPAPSVARTLKRYTVAP